MGDLEFIYMGRDYVETEKKKPSTDVVCNTQPVDQYSKSNKGIKWVKAFLSGLVDLSTHKGNLSRTDLIIILYMMGNIKVGNRCYETQSKIYKYLGLTQQQVSRSIIKLVALGILHNSYEGYYVISSKYIYLDTRSKT
jgi:hypothetical protein